MGALCTKTPLPASSPDGLFLILTCVCTVVSNYLRPPAP